MSDLIKTDFGKKGHIVEQYSPGTEGKIQKAANERLKEIKKAKATLKNPKASAGGKKAAEDKIKFYQSGDYEKDQMGGPFKKPVSKYKAGGRAGYKNGKSVRKKSSRKALRGGGCEIR